MNKLDPAQNVIPTKEYHEHHAKIEALVKDLHIEYECEYTPIELQESNISNLVLQEFDFYIPELKLIIECDVNVETEPKYVIEVLNDIRYTIRYMLFSYGYHYIRLTSTQDIERVLASYLNRTFPYRHAGVWYDSDVSIREALEAKGLDPQYLQPYRYTWLKT